jgi:DNA-binding NarL/FixJ family response regulator
MVHTSDIARRDPRDIVPSGRPHVCVVDPRRLRCACLVRLLDEWAAANGLNVVAASTTDELRGAANSCLVVLSVGGASIFEMEAQFWIRMARSILADTPLVVLSDRDDASEVYAAFKEGAKGYIATSLEPAVALEALTFLRRGGSFFPVSALQGSVTPFAGAESRPEQPAGEWSKRTVVKVSARFASWKEQSADDSAPVHEAKPRADDAGVFLTPRQREVLQRLREGKPNKLIARDLNMTEATVKVHVRQIMHKLGAKNRTQVVLCAARLRADDE